jgi:phosphate transport system protein
MHLRVNFREELDKTEQAALGGIDIVVGQVDRCLEALEHQDVELAEFIIADDDRLDGRYLEVHQGVLSLLALQAPGRRRPADRGGAAAHDQARRADGATSA